MKRPILVLLLALLACIIATVHATESHDHGHDYGDDHGHKGDGRKGCKVNRHDHGDDDDDHHHDHCGESTHARSVTIKSNVGVLYPPSDIDSDGGDEEPRPVPRPTGRPRGPIRPANEAINLTIAHENVKRSWNPLENRQGSCQGSNVVIDNSSIYGGGGNPPDPSGAAAGNVIFATANTYAAVSLDAGTTFHTLDASLYGGPGDANTGALCCDQIVQYVPKIDRFVWLLLFRQNSANVNKLRVITFHPKDVTTTGINAWLYMDLYSGNFGLKTWLDYADIAVGDNWIYVSATAIGQGLVVFRVPLTGLDVASTFTVWYTDAARGNVASESRIGQNPGDTLFWAGHSVVGTTLRVFKWPESGTTYFWNDIRINDFPSDSKNFISDCPGNSTTSWVFSVQFPAVHGITRRTSTEVWLAWPAPSGGGFPNIHVQIAQIDVRSWPNLRLIRQWQIWNKDFAFGYPALSTNACGDVGIALMFGGGVFNPSSAVGVAVDGTFLGSTVYYPALSDVCENRYGDYLAVRPGVGNHFAAFTYSETNIEGIDRKARYVSFGRT